jgi:hypothetical protein
MYKNGNSSENRRLSRDLIRLRLGVEKLEKLETRVRRLWTYSYDDKLVARVDGRGL